MSARLKKCRVCREQFAPDLPRQIVCSVECATEFAGRDRIKRELAAMRRDRAETRQKLKTREDYIKAAQDAANAFIRRRDSWRECISCGNERASAWHAGHYRSVGSAPGLRFDPMNIHRQCAKCNTHLSGNLIGYRQGLLKRYGAEAVERLESDSAPADWTIPELIQIRTHFRSLCNEPSKSKARGAGSRSDRGSRAATEGPSGYAGSSGGQDP